jgi:hypothetical protein
MTWYYENREVAEEDLVGNIAFVYLITNLTSGKKYVGKKLLKFQRTKMVKGKKKKVLIDSDWATYYGSNKELIKDVEEFGAENFRREILEFCKTRGDANYLEARYQFDWRVLEGPGWYNDQVFCRVHRSHLKRG